MIGHPAGLRRLDGIIWAIVAMLAAIAVIAPFVANFMLVGPSFLAAGGGVALCLAGYWLYETKRPDPRLASAVGGTAQIVAFAAVGAPVSYIAASLNLPLRDAWFDAADRALGCRFFMVCVTVRTGTLWPRARKASSRFPACIRHSHSLLRSRCGRFRCCAGSGWRSTV
jgi:hypothetical protein